MDTSYHAQSRKATEKDTARPCLAQKVKSACLFGMRFSLFLDSSGVDEFLAEFFRMFQIVVLMFLFGAVETFEGFYADTDPLTELHFQRFDFFQSDTFFFL